MLKDIREILKKQGYQIIRNGHTLSIFLQDYGNCYKVIVYINNHGNQVALTEENLISIQKKASQMIEVVHTKPVHVMTILIHCGKKDYIKTRLPNIVQLDTKGRIRKTEFTEVFFVDKGFINLPMKKMAAQLKNIELNHKKNKSSFGSITLLFCILLFLLQLKGLNSNHYGASLNNFLEGKLYTIFTYAFIHGNWLHLLSNCSVLFIIGSALEKRIGHIYFIILTNFSLVYGGICTVFFKGIIGQSDVITVGFSGVTFAMCGALLVFEIINNRYYHWILSYILISLGSGFILPFIDNTVHLAGLFSGIGFMAIILILEKSKRDKQRIKVIKLSNAVKRQLYN